MVDGSLGTFGFSDRSSLVWLCCGRVAARVVRQSDLFSRGGGWNESLLLFSCFASAFVAWRFGLGGLLFFFLRFFRFRIAFNGVDHGSGWDGMVENAFRLPAIYIANCICKYLVPSHSPSLSYTSTFPFVWMLLRSGAGSYTSDRSFLPFSDLRPHNLGPVVTPSRAIGF